MKKFAFYVSGNATRLKKFLQTYEKNTIVNYIKFVLIDNVKNLELKSLCQDMNIKFYEIDLKQFENKNKFISDFFYEKLDQHQIDYAFVFADRILIGELLKKYENRLINFHPSLLPAYKGLMSIDQALRDKAFLLGNSAHFITKDLDDGAVIMQYISPAIKFTSYVDILDKQIPMLKQIIQWILEERITWKNGYVHIKEAKYIVSEFIPNLETNE